MTQNRAPRCVTTDRHGEIPITHSRHCSAVVYRWQWISDFCFIQLPARAVLREPCPNQVKSKYYPPDRGHYCCYCVRRCVHVCRPVVVVYRRAPTPPVRRATRSHAITIIMITVSFVRKFLWTSFPRRKTLYRQNVRQLFNRSCNRDLNFLFIFFFTVCLTFSFDGDRFLFYYYFFFLILFYSFFDNAFPSPTFVFGRIQMRRFLYDNNYYRNNNSNS